MRRYVSTQNPTAAPLEEDHNNTPADNRSLKLSSMYNDNSNPVTREREAGFGGHQQQHFRFWSKSRAFITCGLSTLMLCMFLIQMKEVSFVLSPSVGIKMSSFDKMHKEFHKSAAALNHVEKKTYEIGVSMERGTGGLFDTDRTLLADIYSSVDSVFEFGLGESTKIAAWVGVPRYVGVDSDADWVTNIREEVNMDHFRFIFADIGATGAYGVPKNDTLQKIPLSYQSAPLNDEMEAFDFYLIDGRYRVACACASMLHAMSRGGDMQKVMFGVHDYPSRETYRQLESVADIVKESELLRVFQVKPSTTEYDIYQMWKKNMWELGR
jgi:hypothetical protein